MADQRIANTGMSTEDRDRLVMSPVGTPGLVELGLTHPDYADLHAFGPVARAEAMERNAEYRAFMVHEQMAPALAELAALPDKHREMLLRLLLGEKA